MSVRLQLARVASLFELCVQCMCLCCSVLCGAVRFSLLAACLLLAFLQQQQQQRYYYRYS